MHLRYALLGSGRKVVTYRRLENTAPTDARELANAS